MYREYHGMRAQKQEWPAGAWTSEPDKVQFVDEETNYDCLIVRNSAGALCGYVGIPVSHPLHGKEYNDVDVNVHGGLTYSDFCQEDVKEEHGICHLPREATDKIWWLGFDCAHCNDLCPYMTQTKFMGLKTGCETYKNIEYVKQQIKSLASQLKKLELG